MKLKIHRVLAVGAFIYAFTLIFGIYFVSVHAQHQEVSQKSDIVKLLTSDAEGGKGDEGSKSKRPNSRPLIEDDDDSAKDLLIELHFHVAFSIDPSCRSISSYNPYQKEITTPPPWG